MRGCSASAVVVVCGMRGASEQGVARGCSANLCGMDCVHVLSDHTLGIVDQVLRHLNEICGRP